jgi:hypothetical protein
MSIMEGTTQESCEVYEDQYDSEDRKLTSDDLSTINLNYQNVNIFEEDDEAFSYALDDEITSESRSTNIPSYFTIPGALSPPYSSSSNDDNLNICPHCCCYTCHSLSRQPQKMITLPIPENSLTAYEISQLISAINKAKKTKTQEKKSQPVVKRKPKRLRDSKTNLKIKETQAYQQRNIHKSVLKNIISYNNTKFDKKAENVKYGSELVLEADQFLRYLCEVVKKKSDHKKLLEGLLEMAVENEYIMDLAIECLDAKVREMNFGKFRRTISNENKPHYRQIFAEHLNSFRARQKHQ